MSIPVFDAWLTWRMALAATFVIAASVVLVVFFAELREIKSSGGLKAYVKDLNNVGYAAYYGVQMSNIAIGAVTVSMVLHALVPTLVSELQIDAVLALFGFIAATRGITFGAYNAKLKNADPAVIAANSMAADPDVQPVVTTNRQTGETTVSSVPSPSAVAASTVAAAAAAEALKQEVSPLYTPVAGYTKDD